MQYRFFTQMMLVVIFALYCSHAAGAGDREADDPTVVAALQQLGARMERDQQGHVIGVKFSAVKQLTDAQLARLDFKGLPHVETVSLAFRPITNAGLEHVTRLRSLERLLLDFTKVTPAGVNALRRALPQATITNRGRYRGRH